MTATDVLAATLWTAVVVLAGTSAGCGGGASAHAPSGSAVASNPCGVAVCRNPSLDERASFGPYVLGTPLASAPGVNPSMAGYGGFTLVAAPFTYAGVPTKVLLFPEKTKPWKLRTVSLLIELAQCDTVLAQMTRELGPPGRVGASEVSVAGERYARSVHVWRGDKIGFTLEHAALACAASVMVLEGYEDLGGHFKEK
jgi:hypothetical protein